MNKKITSTSLVISTVFLLVLMVSFTKSKQDNFQDQKDPKITNLKLPEVSMRKDYMVLLQKEKAHGYL